MLRILLMLLFLIDGIKVYGFDFVTEVTARRDMLNNEFISTFPFEDYLTKYSICDINSLESHKIYLNNIGFNGHDFIKEAISSYAKNVPLDFTNCSELNFALNVGELFSNSNYFLPDSILVYQVGGDIIFTKIATALENDINSGVLSTNDFNVGYIIQRLIDNKYIIDIPTSNWCKLWRYVKEGRWCYIWHKFTSTYKSEFLVAIGIGLFILSGISFIFYKRSRKINKG